MKIEGERINNEMSISVLGATWYTKVPTCSTSNIPYHLYLLIAAFLAALYKEGKSQLYRDIFEVHKKYDTFFSMVKEIAEKMNNDLFKPLEDLISILPNYKLKIENSQLIAIDFQAQLFHCKTGRFLGCLPFPFNPTKRQVFLTSETGEVISSSTSFLIPHLKPLFQKFGIFCFNCQKYFTTRGCQHRCSKAKTCFACRRLLLLPNTYVNSETEAFFCQESETSQSTEKCKSCNINLFPNSCKELHQRKVCRYGWKCPKCHIYQYRNRFFKSQKDIETKHECNIRKCNFCGQQKEGKFHLCTLKEATRTSEFTNLAFLQVEYTGYNISKCESCYNQNNGESCKECSSLTQETPFSCTLLQEESGRQSFSFQTFYPDAFVKKLREEYQSITKNEPQAFYYSYLPNCVNKELAPEGRKTRFGQRSAAPKCKNVFKKERMTAIEKTLHHIMHHNFTNSTIVVNGGDSKDLFYILQTLLTNGFTPNVVKKQNQLMLIEDKTLGLRFIEAQNYICGSFMELVERMSMPKVFFPLRWIHEKYFDYEGKPPSVKDLFNFEDSEEDIAHKTEFVRNLDEKWSFQKELHKYLFYRIQVLARSLLDFLKEAFESQLALFEHLAKNTAINNEQDFLHPFNPPIFTAATYAFQLYLKVSNGAKQIKTIKNAIQFQSSKGEIEYVSFVEWKNPHLKLDHAWSDYGQVDLKYSKPDAYAKDANTVFYYHGCYFHGHAKSDCKHKKIKRAETERTLLREKFNQKMSELRKYFGVTTLHTMWECIWKEQKRYNDEVIHFMKTIYRNPPMSRLNPHDAVRGGLTEVYRLFWNSTRKSSEVMHYLDKIGAYAFIAMTSLFPVGDYRILTYSKLTEWFHDSKEGRLKLNSSQVMCGIALVRVKCPNIKIPILPYRSEITKMTSIPVCRTCADTANNGICNHTER